MTVAAEKFQKPLRKMRKSLKKLSLTPDRVHGIRTRARRIEAVFHALGFDATRSGSALIGKIASIRKKAGRVRDMDVLTDYAAGLSGEIDSDCLVQLLEYLGARRLQQAEKLRRRLLRGRRKLRRALKRYIALSGREFGAQNGRNFRDNGKHADASAGALALSEELAAWPALDEHNLHAFRLKVKELRYVLQLAQNPDTPLLRSLGDAKDAIGKWHDLHELSTIAAEVIDHAGRCAVRDQIELHAKNEFEHALAVSNELRRKYLQAQPVGGESNAGRPEILQQPAVLETAAPAGLKAGRAR
jgi:CHAD domain-containing protein